MEIRRVNINPRWDYLKQYCYVAESIDEAEKIINMDDKEVEVGNDWGDTAIIDMQVSAIQLKNKNGEINWYAITDLKKAGWEFFRDGEKIVVKRKGEIKKVNYDKFARGIWTEVI